MWKRRRQTVKAQASFAQSRQSPCCSFTQYGELDEASGKETDNQAPLNGFM